jgi:hypothetical protein
VPVFTAGVAARAVPPGRAANTLAPKPRGSGRGLGDMLYRFCGQGFRSRNLACRASELRDDIFWVFEIWDIGY